MPARKKTTKKPLSERLALITGGATGIGFGIASYYAELGAHVILASRNEENLEQAVKRIKKAKGDATFIALDVRDFAAVETAMQSIISDHGCLDILVNNAAGNFICPTAELSPNAWKAVIDIDLNGTFHCCKAAYPALCESRFGGRIINITMTRTVSGWPGCAHAAAAKAGILSLTRTLAVEWGGQGIRVNAIAPGLVTGTEGANRLVEQQGKMNESLASIPLGRLAYTQDIANMAVFLASPAADHISGTEFTVDGGQRWNQDA